MSEDGAIRVSLHQPNFLPWAKLFDKILASDVYIAYDSVQYTHTEFHARQWITGRDGPVWLSAPVLTRGRGRQPLYAAELVPGRAWRDAHLRLLAEHYRGAPYFHEVIAVLGKVYEGDDHLLVDFNLRLLHALLDYVGASVRVVRATCYEHVGDNTERVIQLTQAVGGDVHLTSTYGTRAGTSTGNGWRRPGSPSNPSGSPSRATGSSSSRSGRTCQWWTCCSRWVPPRPGCSARCASSTGCSPRHPR